jgi:hypothetical protein
MSNTGTSFFGLEAKPKYTATCKISKKYMAEMIKHGQIINVSGLKKQELGDMSGVRTSTSKVADSNGLVDDEDISAC